MRDYLNLLRIKGAIRLSISSIPARMAYAMSGLAVFFHVQNITHSLSNAGFAVGAYSLVSSLTASVRGHAVDRWGQTIPLLLLVPGYSIACFVLGFVASDGPSAIALSAMIGLLSPPINISIRPLWKELVDDAQVRTAYAFDSVISNAVSLIGPALGSWCALHFSGAVAMSVTGLLMMIGGMALLTTKLSREWIPEARVPGEHGLLRSPAMRMLAFNGILTGLGFGLLDVAIPSAASLADMKAWAAPSLGAVALGGIIGGIAAGSWFKHLSPGLGLTQTTFAFSLVSVPMFLLPPGPVTVFAMFVLGIPIGATQVYYLEVIDMVRPRGTAVAAMGTLWSIEGSAVAAGNALAGFISENLSTTIAMIAIGPLLFTSGVVLRYGLRGSLKPSLAVFIPDQAE